MTGFILRYLDQKNSSPYEYLLHRRSPANSHSVRASVANVCHVACYFPEILVHSRQQRRMMAGYEHNTLYMTISDVLKTKLAFWDFYNQNIRQGYATWIVRRIETML